MVAAGGNCCQQVLPPPVLRYLVPSALSKHCSEPSLSQCSLCCLCGEPAKCCLVLSTAVCVPWCACSSRQQWCIPLPRLPEVGQAGGVSLCLAWHGAGEPPVCPCTEAGFTRQAKDQTGTGNLQSYHSDVFCGTLSCGAGQPLGLGVPVLPSPASLRPFTRRQLRGCTVEPGVRQAWLCTAEEMG